MQQPLVRLGLMLSGRINLSSSQRPWYCTPLNNTLAPLFYASSIYTPPRRYNSTVLGILEQHDWCTAFTNLKIGISNAVSQGVQQVTETAVELPLKILVMAIDAPYFLPKNVNTSYKFAHTCLLSIQYPTKGGSTDYNRKCMLSLQLGKLLNSYQSAVRYQKI